MIREKGYFGYTIEGDELFSCSSHEKIILFWSNGQYKVVTAPEKVFVDDNLLYAAPYDRKQELLVVYREDIITYMKRFRWGGVIINREYTCIPEGAELLLFDHESPEELYVKYKKVKRQRVHQQTFHPGKLTVKSVKSRGNQMTVKTIRSISTKKPRNWDKNDEDGQLFMLDFL